MTQLPTSGPPAMPGKWTSRLSFAAGMLALMVGALLCLPMPDFPGFVRAFILGDMRLMGVGAMATGGVLTFASYRRAVPGGLIKPAAAVASTMAVVLLVTGTWNAFGAYATESVSFMSGGTRLAGRLYRPRGADRRTALSFVPGSESVSGARYHSFADRLARAGFVVLVPDKRGVGRSEGVFEQPQALTHAEALLSTLAADVAVSVQYLRAVEGVDSTRTGYFGVSQAGWVIPLAERHVTGAAFAVILSGPAVSTGEEEAFSRLSGEDADHFGWKPPPISIDSINRRVATIAASGFDPAPVLRAMRIPTLWIYGDWDNSGPVDKSALVLDSLAGTGIPFTVHRYAYGNHGVFVMRGPAKRRLPYYPDSLWANTFRWISQSTPRVPRL